MDDLSDETRNMEALDCRGDLCASLSFKLGPPVLVLKAPDGEFPVCYGFEEHCSLSSKRLKSFSEQLSSTTVL